MGWFSDDSAQAQYSSDYYDGGCQPHHEAKFSHELIGGAAAYEAAKAYEDHLAANGQPTSHAKAKEVLAGLAGAFIDREFETKGLDFMDRERAKSEANRHIDQLQDGDYQY